MRKNFSAKYYAANPSRQQHLALHLRTQGADLAHP